MSHILQINELFTSLQGESSRAGEPCFFIRLTGCPLRCVWCDTEYSFFGGEDYSIEQLVEEAKKSGCKLVEVTGGEPLGQKEAIPLMEALLEEGFQVMLETSGALPIKNVPKSVMKIVDIKCPGSGMAERMLWENFDYLEPNDEIKCVIGDRKDYLWAKEQLKSRNLLGNKKVLFSPVHGSIDSKELAEWILQDRLPVKMQLQLHKILWPEKSKGY